MPVKNHESILFTVDKHRYRDKKLIKRYVFRTYEDANKFQEERNKRSSTFEYKEPVRSEWGPA